MTPPICSPWIPLGVEGAKWVGQDEPNGCVCAAFAMVLGVAYQEARALFPYGSSAEGYYPSTTVHMMLKRQGWKVEYRTPHKPKGDPWPPEPFAPVHMATVLVKQGAACWHSVVMRADGVVLDPLTPEPRRLSDYLEVQAVVGLTSPPSPARQPIKASQGEAGKRQAPTITQHRRK